MAFAATSVWECRTTGSTANGGGFDPGVASPGTDYSQQDAAQTAYTDLVIDGVTNTKATSAAHPFDSTSPGNFYNITAGTGFTVQRVVCLSVSGSTATFDKSLGTLGSTGGTGSLGGAHSDPALVAGLMVAGNQLYLKQGTYAVTSTSTNAAAGVISLPAGSSAAQPTRLIGYNATRTDFGTRPLIQAQGGFAGSATILTCGSNTLVANVIVDAALKATTRCFNCSGTGSIYYVCKALNATNCGWAGTGTSSNQRLLFCEATGCTTVGPAIRDVGGWYCVAHDNTVAGFDGGTANIHYVGCVSCNNTGATSDGFLCSGASQTSTYIDCTAYANGRHGFNLTAEAFPVTCINCLATNHTAGGAYGFNLSASSGLIQLFNCAGYNNTANVNTANMPLLAAQQIGFVAITSDPFTNAAGNDFSLNGVGAGGQLARLAGLPAGVAGTAQLPGLSSLAFADIGALQHLDSGPMGGCVW